MLGVLSSEFMAPHICNTRNGCIYKICKPRAEWSSNKTYYYKAITDWVSLPSKTKELIPWKAFLNTNWNSFDSTIFNLSSRILILVLFSWKPPLVYCMHPLKILVYYSFYYYFWSSTWTLSSPCYGSNPECNFTITILESQMLFTVESRLAQYKPRQTIATCLHNILQHCWTQHVATWWPNARNILRATMVWYVALTLFRSFGWGLKIS